MPTLAESIAAIQAHLDDAPDDWDARRVLADALAEAGDVDGERCQRWMVANGKRPWLYPPRWWWFEDSDRQEFDADEMESVPTDIFNRMGSLVGWGPSLMFNTRQLAEQAMAAALAAAATPGEKGAT